MAYNLAYKMAYTAPQQQRSSRIVPTQHGGPYRTRTCDPLRVMQVRYQLRQRPARARLAPGTVGGLPTEEDESDWVLCHGRWAGPPSFFAVACAFPCSGSSSRAC